MVGVAHQTCGLVRKSCFLLYFIHGPPVFSTLGRHVAQCADLYPGRERRGGDAQVHTAGGVQLVEPRAGGVHNDWCSNVPAVRQRDAAHGPRMLNTRGDSSFNDYNTNNTRILARKMCILLYFIHGPPVFSILGGHHALVPPVWLFWPATHVVTLVFPRFCASKHLAQCFAHLVHVHGPRLNH